jgi:predicted ester cyclase
VTVLGVDGRDIAEILAPQGPRRQPLQGFDPDYADLVDYILRCTHRIWEQKDIGLIETHYGDDCPIHLMTGTAHGLAGVVDGTLRTLGGFPDRTLVGEAVIWSGDEDAGYLSSHRITSTGTNWGGSELGPATGRRVAFTTIADCLCRENRIVEEWLVRDNSAIVWAMGQNPRDVARAQAEADRRTGEGPQPWRVERMARVRAATPTPFPDRAVPDAHADPEAWVCWFVDCVLNHRRLAAVRDAYAPNARVHAPGGRRLFGHGETVGWWAALLGCFGGARVRIDHVAHQPAPDGALDVALRWELAGRHDGPALYGAPSGRDCYILAATHWRIERGRVAREWTVFDEVALLRQIEGGL